jgi:SAM-dependent methyltransferase
MAAPLTRFINGRGSYVGFDIVRSGIEWCQQNISARHGNFTFIHSDVFNKHYNPSGKIRASEFSFPVDERKFDFVLATSVFTHMLPKDLERYLSEISRVMKTGGRCLVTFFLMNDESRRGNRSGMSVFNFRDFSPQCSVVNMSDPEMAIAYDESYVRRQLRERGLALQEPIQYGSWSGRKDHLSFQDIVVAVKEPSRPAGND